MAVRLLRPLLRPLQAEPEQVVSLRLRLLRLLRLQAVMSLLRLLRPLLHPAVQAERLRLRLLRLLRRPTVQGQEQLLL